MRRTRLVRPQAELWPDWRHFPFVTNRTEPLDAVEVEHRHHPVVERAIRELQDRRCRQPEQKTSWNSGPHA